ncbi:hypothetical protein SANTM175S_06560 [Streptomyces antimycoticus]
MPGDTMGELHPLGENLPEECRAFAVELRKLFLGLGISVRGIMPCAGTVTRAPSRGF